MRANVVIVTGFVIVLIFFVLLLLWFFIKRIRRRNQNRGFVHSSVPVQTANSSRSTPFSPCIPPCPPIPPPLGFGEQVDTTHYLNTYPPKTPKAPYPLHSQNIAPYPTETSCYPPAHTAPYPVDSSMPQPSASRNTYYSDGNICESVSPVRPSTSRTLGFFESNTEQMLPFQNRMLYPPASSASYPPERQASYGPIRRVPFPPHTSSSELPPSYHDAVKKL